MSSQQINKKTAEEGKKKKSNDAHKKGDSGKPRTGTTKTSERSDVNGDVEQE